MKRGQCTEQRQPGPFLAGSAATRGTAAPLAAALLAATAAAHIAGALPRPASALPHAAAAAAH